MSPKFQFLDDTGKVLDSSREISDERLVAIAKTLVIRHGFEVTITKDGNYYKRVSYARRE